MLDPTQNRHFDRSCLWFYREQRSGEIRFSTHAAHPAYFLSLCPRSNPNLGADFVPLIFTGISAPAPSFLKNGSTGFNRIDFHFEATICDNFASVRIFPAKSNRSPSSEYSPVRPIVAPGNV